MSNEAITWALSQPVKHSSAKFVLVVMANRADTNLICWPSMADICAQTAQDRKTVQENIRRLREAGFIEDTGERKGSTKQVIVYRLKTPEIGLITTSDEDQCGDLNAGNERVEEAQKRNSSENGIGPNFPPKRPEIPYEEAQISHERGPKTGHGTQKEPSKETTGNPNKRGQAAQDDFDPMAFLENKGVGKQVAKDWLKIRKGKKLVPTLTAFEEVIDQAEKAGMSLHQAVHESCKRGWGGFKAAWLQNENQARASPSGQLSKAGQVTARNAQQWLEDNDAS